MSNEIIEFNNIIPKILCDEIIKKFENTETTEKYKNKTQHVFNFKQVVIPKQNDLWVKIEVLLYKQLLLNLNKYKEKNFDINNFNNEINILLNKKLYTTSFFIQKYVPSENNIYIEDFNKINSRYNCFTFVYFLNSSDEAEITIESIESNESNEFNKKTTTIHPKKGNLIIYTENLNNNYKYKLPSSEKSLYIITGQIYEKI